MREKNLNFIQKLENDSVTAAKGKCKDVVCVCRLCSHLRGHTNTYANSRCPNVQLITTAVSILYIQSLQYPA